MAAMSFLGCAAQLQPHPTHNLATVSFKVRLATGAARSGCNANRRAVRQCVQVTGLTSQWINHIERWHVEGSSQITASQGIVRNKWWTNVERWEKSVLWRKQYCINVVIPTDSSIVAFWVQTSKCSRTEDHFTGYCKLNCSTCSS